MSDLLDEILREAPRFHRTGTEIRDLAAAEGFTDEAQAEGFRRRESVNWGVDPNVARFLFEAVQPGWRTLETGAGISTVVFAMRGVADHTAITPETAEAQAIRAYAATKRISTESVEFVHEASEWFLPGVRFDLRARLEGRDLVLIDGKHAFPWPILDWFYTADLLRQGGLMVLDDTNLQSVRMLTDFLDEEQGRWRLRHDFNYRTRVYEKLTRQATDVAWNMQPYIVRRANREGVAQRLARAPRRLLGRLRGSNS